MRETVVDVQFFVHRPRELRWSAPLLHSKISCKGSKHRYSLNVSSGLDQRFSHIYRSWGQGRLRQVQPAQTSRCGGLTRPAGRVRQHLQRTKRLIPCSAPPLHPVVHHQVLISNQMITPSAELSAGRKKGDDEESLGRAEARTKFPLIAVIVEVPSSSKPVKLP
jgi:hypothetical protein